MSKKILNKGKIPEKNITDEKSSVKKQKTKVSFPVSDDENVRLGEMAQRAGKTKSQFMHDSVFTPDIPEVTLLHGGVIRFKLAEISDILCDIMEVLTAKRNLNIMEVKASLDQLIAKTQNIRTLQCEIELIFSDIMSEISQLSQFSASEIDDNDEEV